jgi:hypothetical protein
MIRKFSFKLGYTFFFKTKYVKLTSTLKRVNFKNICKFNRLVGEKYYPFNMASSSFFFFFFFFNFNFFFYLPVFFAW